MIRGYKKKLIIFSIFAVILLIVGSFYLNFQLSTKNNYLNLKNGKEADATFTPLSNSERSKYVYVFNYNGQNYTSTTLLSYTASEINSLTISNYGKLKIRFLTVNDEVVLSTSEKSNLNGHSIAQSCEDYYFAISKPPSFSASIVIFFFSLVCILFAVIYYIKICAIKSIQRDGVFTYAVFVEAYPSPLGSNRYMAVKYSYLNENEEWIESVSPYAYTPSNVELLKNLEAISIKYKGNRSVIIETLSLKY